MSLIAELLEEYQSEIETIKLVPSSGGVFEVIVNDTLIFSKKNLERHAEPGEVISLFGNHINSNN
ncbi:MAG TPA: hypothetical protein DCL76_04065 [Chloroflexi bacterium]|nr:hypothetical protein [Chloroflexota bacterium]HCU98708.1 hypothetical protein [Chloroflexota bacterium]